MKVLVVSVHPDDETLGVGGTLLKHRDQGDEIHWLIFTSVEKSDRYSSDFKSNRKAEISEVACNYNITSVCDLGYEPSELHKVDIGEMIAKVSDYINSVKPEVVYTVNRSDIHTDHRIASEVVMSCTKSFRYPFINRILAYECISETDMALPYPENVFIPNVFSDITDVIEEKIAIMEIYKSEVQEIPFPRSLQNIKALARYRGSMAHYSYAESFMLLREKF